MGRKSLHLAQLERTARQYVGAKFGRLMSCADGKSLFVGLR